MEHSVTVPVACIAPLPAACCAACSGASHAAPARHRHQESVNAKMSELVLVLSMTSGRLKGASQDYNTYTRRVYNAKCRSKIVRVTLLIARSKDLLTYALI